MTYHAEFLSEYEQGHKASKTFALKEKIVTNNLIQKFYF